MTKDDGFLGSPNKASADIVAVRGSTHGNFSDNATIAQDLKYVMRGSAQWGKLTPRKKEALEQIALKISRILSEGSDPDFAEHWDDIGGYAALGKTKEDVRA